uniref:Transposase IS200-like domain-containing protein n=1 Tax=Candidatus Methanogaster sp. ANME-2c ERB4 TaxID=2759911 RepID=A0A7G9YJM7_9EURY|nr:hypothetical protein PGANABGL_00025 [Methanosarcinales archaeon ANME-2c ERB4]
MAHCFYRIRTKIFRKLYGGLRSWLARMERNELRHDRHTDSLLTDHTVYSPKYRGNILVGDVALALDGSIRKTCKNLDIEIIDMTVNADHVHLFVKYPPKYSMSYITKRIKERGSRELRKAFPHLRKWCKYRSVGAVPLPLVGRAWDEMLWSATYGIRRMRKRDVQAPYLSPGFSDFGRLA